MKFHKKKIFCAIMALMACVLIVASPNKVKAEVPSISPDTRIYSDGVTPGISSNTYYYKGYATCSSGIDHIEIRLFKYVNGEHELYRSESINCNNTCRVDFSRNQELSHILSSNTEGHYKAVLIVYSNDGHRRVNEQYHYITKSLGSYMAGLYKYILGRDPEMEGYVNNMKAVSYGGVSIEKMIRFFYDCPEYNGNPRPNTQDFVTSLYRSILRREPDPEGYANHINGLWNGASRESVINVFLNSDEFQYRVIPEYGLR